MVKKIISVATAFLMLCCMIPFGVFADDVLEDCPKCGKHTYTKFQDFSMSTSDFSFPIALKKRYCSSCDYTYYEWNCLGMTGYKDFDNGGYSLIVDYLHEWADNTFGKNATAEKFTPGGGSTSGGGAGRKDLPGYCDTGDGTSTPQVDSNGKFVDGWVYVTPEHDYSYIAPGYGGYYAGCEHYTQTITNKLNASFTCSSLPFLAAYSNSSSGFTNGYFGNHFYFYWKVNVPAYSYVRFLSFGQYTFNSVLDGKTTTTKNTFSNSRALNTEYYMGSETLFFFDEFGNFSNQTYFSATYSALPVIQYKPPQFNNISYNTNLTINKNTWNGNIYTDNSTNLTYIYPQYTTINEKNETVTNISNNPIIYNNETKQYYTYDSVTNNYYYITYETTPTPTPSPSPAPAPTWTPGGGATRGGGVGRHPSDTDAADWTLHYYILNNRRYDAYYALKKTEVNTETKLPWVDNKKYISTTQIPIANGQYTVSVPDGVYWRVWQWDEASQTLTGVNSSNWHSTINNFLFNATGEYIFEFCKADGSDFNTAKDVTLKLKNDKITEYEPGGALDTEPVTPETQNLIIPKMNSNTFTDEHGTWIASGSSKYSDVFDFFRAFDRSTSEIWETNQSPSHLQIEIPDPDNYYIDGYIMRISKFTNRYAKEWTLQGSDDGKTWDDLDTQKDQNLSDMQEHKYTLTLRKAYKYYRLNMSNYASSMCSLSHFNLLGYDAKDVVTPTPAPTDPPSPSPAPDPGTDPTPVPTPGGGTVPAPGGDSNISGGDGEGLFGWIWDLLKDIVKSILKAIFKIIANILGFLIWIVERVGLLLPFLPGPAVAALGAGVVLVFVIRIIRFIRG